MILMIDNYDSFTYNLVQEMGKLGAAMDVVRNDCETIEQLQARQPTAIIISPGPCTPAEAGISIDVVKAFSGRVPILGVCLGYQSIVAACGGVIAHAGRIMHGKTSPVRHWADPLFDGVDNPFDAGRYHSLMAEREAMPAALQVTAESIDDQTIMAVRHREHPTVGIQFHPESVLTPAGPVIMRNFLALL